MQNKTYFVISIQQCSSRSTSISSAHEECCCSLNIPCWEIIITREYVIQCKNAISCGSVLSYGVVTQQCEAVITRGGVITCWSREERGELNRSPNLLCFRVSLFDIVCRFAEPALFFCRCFVREASHAAVQHSIVIAFFLRVGRRRGAREDRLRFFLSAGGKSRYV